MSDARSLVLRLPWPPSLNAIWRAFNGRLILSKTAREYIKSAPAHLPTGRIVPFTGRLVVWLTLHAPAESQRFDIANREKLLCDLLTKQKIWIDDEQIDLLVISRGDSSGKGWVDILINEI